MLLLRYTLRNNTALFAVNPATGRVTVTSSSLNFEVRSSYVFVMRVTDAAGLFAEAPLSITVLDDNDAPVFAGANITVSENAAAEVPFGRLLVQDEDKDEVRQPVPPLLCCCSDHVNLAVWRHWRRTGSWCSSALQTFSWEILSGGAGKVTVAPASGQLVLAEALDFEDVRR
jgi:hypothetical protein